MKIKTNIKKILEQEKLRYLENENFSPISLYNPTKDGMCIVITGLPNCNGMQLVGEFNQEPGLDNLTLCYGVLGNQIAIVDTKTFKDVYSNFDDEYENSDLCLLNIYKYLLVNTFDKDTIEFIKFCTKLKKIKEKREILIKRLKKKTL